ncbi:hypothetical protein K505DRAFT_367024 [Melanomma pulvis-pyrius CBS 109.77]|uniref:Protein kinase domain-containing protein n=1 Tax=Melanomma pulvis-pyrius CBS 109.77 TaxID=1314802 RepID=A0A6A6WUP0_9PLEO|nr:hypothetical protein K505DRAFT_367024 [Melanomma pulvis-pyrius CBS 109.77]
MALRIGQVLHGARWNYRLVESLSYPTSNSHVFKAEIIPPVQSKLLEKWAVIKTTSEEELQRTLKREYDCYMNPAIHSSWNFRTMYDTIKMQGSSAYESPDYLAFEWFDCTLKDVSSESHKRNPVLHKSISKAVLGALADLKSQRLVHTDIQSDNILISGLNTPCPVVKLGGLGLTKPEGFSEFPVQPYAVRAPEVWSGLGCFHRSDMWAFAATLFDWISPRVFGTGDMPPHHWPQAWSMAKLERLFPDSVTEHPTDPNYQIVEAQLTCFANGCYSQKGSFY